MWRIVGNIYEPPKSATNIYLVKFENETKPEPEALVKYEFLALVRRLDVVLNRARAAPR